MEHNSPAQNSAAENPGYRDQTKSPTSPVARNADSTKSLPPVSPPQKSQNSVPRLSHIEGLCKDARRTQGSQLLKKVRKLDEIEELRAIRLRELDILNKTTKRYESKQEVTY